MNDRINRPSDDIEQQRQPQLSGNFLQRFAQQCRIDIQSLIEDLKDATEKVRRRRQERNERRKLKKK